MKYVLPLYIELCGILFDQVVSDQECSLSRKDLCLFSLHSHAVHLGHENRTHGSLSANVVVL